MSDPAQDNQVNSGDVSQTGVSPWSGGGLVQDDQGNTQDWSQNGDQPVSQVQQTPDNQGVVGGQQPVGGGVGQTEQLVGRPTKEVEPIKSGTGETVNVVEMDRQREFGEVSPELKEYVKEEPKESLKLYEKVMHGGKVLMEPAEPVDMPQVVLPMTKQSFLVNVHGPVKKSATWLAVFCRRLISKFRDRVVYSPVESQ